MVIALRNFFRGDSKDFEVDLSDKDVDISADEITLTLKVNLGDADADAVLQYVHIVPGGNTDGKTTVQVPASGAATTPPSNTSAIPPGFYHYDIQWERTGLSPPKIETLQSSGMNRDGTELEKVQVFEDVTLGA